MCVLVSKDTHTHTAAQRGCVSYRNRTTEQGSHLVGPHTHTHNSHITHTNKHIYTHIKHTRVPASAHQEHSNIAAMAVPAVGGHRFNLAADLKSTELNTKTHTCFSSMEAFQHCSDGGACGGGHQFNLTAHRKSTKHTHTHTCFSSMEALQHSSDGGARGGGHQVNLAAHPKSTKHTHTCFSSMEALQHSSDGITRGGGHPR